MTLKKTFCIWIWIVYFYIPKWKNSFTLRKSCLAKAHILTDSAKKYLYLVEDKSAVKYLSMKFIHKGPSFN